MSYLFQDPKFWLLISFITFVILMIKPFKSMMIGGIDSKIEEIKLNINNSLETYNKAEEKLKDAEKQIKVPESKEQKTIKSKEVPKLLEIRCEIFISKKDFNKIKKRYDSTVFDGIEFTSIENLEDAIDLVLI